MDTRSLSVVERITDRLFSIVHSQAVHQSDEGRLCEWLLDAMWHQLVAFSGPRAASALYGQVIVEAARNWPMLSQLKVTERGIDTSALRKATYPADHGLMMEACRVVLHGFLNLIVIISGDSLALALADRVEAEIRGLTAGSEAADRTKRSASGRDGASAA